MAAERSSRVLIVDDEPDICDILERTLAGEGYEAVVAVDSRLRGIDLRELDLALVDMFMPEHDGIEVIQRVREASPFAAVIAMSGDPNFAGMNALDLARRMGADATLTKPFELRTVIDLCTDVLARMRAGPARERRDDRGEKPA